LIDGLRKMRDVNSSKIADLMEQTILDLHAADAAPSEDENGRLPTV